MISAEKNSGSPRSRVSYERFVVLVVAGWCCGSDVSQMLSDSPCYCDWWVWAVSQGSPQNWPHFKLIPARAPVSQRNILMKMTRKWSLPGYQAPCQHAALQEDQSEVEQDHTCWVRSTAVSSSADHVIIILTATLLLVCSNSSRHATHHLPSLGSDPTTTQL